MSTQISADLAVVGAGLVGSSAALALALQHPELNIVLIDAGPEPKCLEQYSTLGAEVDDFDPRVVALTRESQQFMEQLGAWPQLAALRVSPYTDMQVWDADGTGRIEFDCSEVQQNNLGHIVENRLLVAALWEQVQACANISTYLNSRVDAIESISQGQQLLLNDGRTINATIVLACDGAMSPLRQQQDIPTREWDYGHHAIVTTVETREPHDGIARQRFLSTGPLAFLPLLDSPGQHPFDARLSSIVWSSEPELAETLMAMDDEEFSSALGKALENELGEVVSVAKRFCIPLRQRHASEYIRSGFALAGDAAHTIHPLAGQGVNLGLQDIQAFVKEVGYALGRNVSLGDPSLLRRYQRARQAENLTMMAAMEGFKRLFGSRNLGLRWLRNEGMRQLNSAPALKNRIIRQAMGL